MQTPEHLILHFLYITVPQQSFMFGLVLGFVKFSWGSGKELVKLLALTRTGSIKTPLST